MKTEKKILKSASIIAGALLTTTLAASPSAGMNILAYNDLGSGAQLRSHLVDANSIQSKQSEATAYKFGELKCGEGEKKTEKKAEGEKSEAKKTDAKKSDVKQADTKSEKKTEATEEKSKEAKCGEGKCGEGKCGA